MEWTVVSVIVALCGFVLSVFGIVEKILKPLRENIEDATTEIKKNTETINKFNSDIVSISLKLEGTNQKLDKHRESAHRNFEKIFAEVDEHGTKLIEHENRLSNLEKEKKQ